MHLGALGCTWMHLGVLGFTWVYLGVLGFTWMYLDVLGLTENTEREDRTLDLPLDEKRVLYH